jgi:hypothetical protein
MTKLLIDGRVPEGNGIAVQVNAGPGWRAFQEGRSLDIATDPLGFIVLHPAAAVSTHIELQYHGTTEQRVMAAVSAAVWCGAAILACVSWRKRRS